MGHTDFSAQECEVLGTQVGDEIGSGNEDVVESKETFDVGFMWRLGIRMMIFECDRSEGKRRRNSFLLFRRQYFSCHVYGPTCREVTLPLFRFTTWAGKMLTQIDRHHGVYYKLTTVFVDTYAFGSITLLSKD